MTGHPPHAFQLDPKTGVIYCQGCRKTRDQIILEELSTEPKQDEGGPCVTQPFS